MKKNLAYICFTLSLASITMTNAVAQVDSTTYKQIVKSLNDTKKKFAPDQRTKLLEIAQSDVSKNNYLIQSTEKEAVSFLKDALKNTSAKIEYRLLPDSSVGDRIFGVINLSVANLRTKPGHASEMATQALLGTQVDILQKARSEFRVRTPEGYISWVPTSAVSAKTKAEIENWKKSDKVIYTNEFGKAYSQPNSQSIRVSDLVYGNILQLTKEDGQYYEVKYPDGRVGFIPKNEATSFGKWIDSRQLTSDNVISSAKTMLGLPYLWGGTSVKGVDCSGFTKTAFYMNGYVIPRDASQQVLAGDKVEINNEKGEFDTNVALKNLKPADLLFFAAGKNSNPNARVTHVAIYIGNGEFIHSAGTVRINSILKDANNYDDFQTRTVVAARRYVGSNDKQVEKIQQNPYYKN